MYKNNYMDWKQMSVNFFKTALDILSYLKRSCLLLWPAPDPKITESSI